MNMSPANNAHFEVEKEAILLILTQIGDEIYSTVDACQTVQEMWEAIERLQQGKEIAKPITPPSESASEEDNDPEQAQRDKDMQKNLAIIAKKPRRVKDFAYHKVQNDAGYNVFANDLLHFKQSESISNTCLVETDDSNVIPDSPNMCEDDIQNDQNDVESDDERVALANLIANLKLDVDENKKIQKQLKKANITLAQELKECKTILAKTSNALGESISVWDSCLVALQTKQTEFEKYKAFNDYTIDYDKLKRKLNETLGHLAQKYIEIKEGLKTIAYGILVVKEKHDELIKHSLLTKSHYEGLVKQKTKVIMDLKLREEHDIDKMLSMEKQLKFLNEIVYKRSQSIQTIHMMAPKVSTYNDFRTLTREWWNSKIRTGREVAVGMSWEDFKNFTREEFCPGNEMQKLETELWNHTMVEAGHAAYTNRFHELASNRAKDHPKPMQIAGILTDEAHRNGTIKTNPEKKGNGEEPSKDRNGKEDN
nr:reverse transcriptase domain-containing protein [Tanacetum cinerariifolium]